MIHRRVGLEKFHPAVGHGAAALGADDAGGHGFREAKGIADCEDHLADPHVVTIPKRERLDISRVDFQHRDVRQLVAADQPGWLGTAIRELHHDAVHVLDDMVIREDVTFARDDDARAERSLQALTRLARLTIAEEKLEWVDGFRQLHAALRIHADHAGDHGGDDAGIFRIERGEHLDIFRVDLRPGRGRVFFRTAPRAAAIRELRVAVDGEAREDCEQGEEK